MIADASRGRGSWVVLVLGVFLVVIATAALTATVLASWHPLAGGMMGGGYGPGMMGGGYGTAPGPGSPGFVAGTLESPRTVAVVAGPGYRFTPSDIPVAPGETITFVVTTMGPEVHEFMVGPAGLVSSHDQDEAGDASRVAEIDDLGMMETRTLTYTFDGPGPYAYACHLAGHYEAGMRGTITFVE